jgi:hypothetical protein
MNEFINPHILNLNQTSEDKLITVLSTLLEVKNILQDDNVFSSFELDPIVAGGAIRDILTNKSNLVKDIDIFVSFECFIINPLLFEKFKQSCYDAGYIESTHKYLPPDEQMSDSQFILKALNRAMSNYYSDIKEIASQDNSFALDDSVNVSEVDKEYQDSGINGVLKINDDYLPCPVDLIINFISPANIVHFFDFDFCKIYMSSSYDTESSVLSNARDNILMTDEFKHNLEQKKITMDANHYSEAAIIRSFESHLPRLMAKYPDYEVEVSNLTEATQIVLDKVMLEKNLGQNKTEQLTRKIKI